MQIRDRILTLCTWGLWLFCTIAVVSPAAANEAADPPMLRVGGYAKLAVPPDLARLRVVVVSENADATGASQENARRSQAVIDALEDAIAKDGKVTTLGYGVSPQYRYDRGAQILVGYRAQNTLQIETRQLDRVGDWIDTALEAGANSIASLEFTLSDDTELRGRALALAAQRARQNANAMADALDVKLLRLIDAHEERGAPVAGPIRNARALSAHAEGASATPVLPGVVQIETRVGLTFEISGR